jgi:inhibitor of KinA sporulation pathway (predicted exonuclease)
MIKKLSQHIRHKRHLVFLDFEGTQLSHEMIAFGAVKVDLNDDYSIKKTYKGIHRYVRPTQEIGRYVTKLTQITEADLLDKGIPFAQAMTSLRNYVGKKFEDAVFIVFGNHDLRILNQSLAHSPDADEVIIKTITKNSIDFSKFIAEFIKDEKGNPLSLLNNLLVFNYVFKGNFHQPLDDAKNLLKLYELTLKNPDIIFTQYQQQLSRYHHLPGPIQTIMNKIYAKETVDYQVFQQAIKDYLK